MLYCFPHKLHHFTSYQQCLRVSVSQPSLLVSFFLGVKRYLIVVLICIPLVVSDVDYPMFVRLYIFFFEKCLFYSFVQFLFGLFVFITVAII
jgi:hypothetical protein